MRLFKEYFNKIYAKAEERYREIILNNMEYNPKSTFLDCGCDTGELTLAVSGILGSRNVYGIDVVRERYAKAEERGVVVKNSDLNNTFPFESNYFDIVLANQVIEHVWNLEGFVQEIYRVLKNNGCAIISTENLSSWHNIFALILGYQAFSMSNIVYGKNIGNPLALHSDKERFGGMSAYGSFMHTRVLSYYGWLELFRMNGFRIERVSGSGYYPAPSSVASILTSIDKRHAAFLVFKLRKIQTDEQ